jgi:peptidoglycan-N-acetylglucosamine deacetylase
VSGPRQGSWPRWVLAAAAGLGLVQVAPAVTWSAAVRRHLAPTLSGLGRPGHLALTFDDGPHPAGTSAVLAALEALGWRATFFMLGDQVRARPWVAAEVAAAGHEIAVHGDTHRYLLGRSPRATHDDLARAVESVTAATGSHPRWFRPPYGVLSGGVLPVLARLGLQPVLWTAWGREWRAEATPGSAAETLARGVLDGGTALLHDSDVAAATGCWQVTVRTLPLLAERVMMRGLVVGTLAEHGLPARHPSATG